MNGLIHYIYGNGPGKTSSSFGKVIRAYGHGLKPIIIQFLKESQGYLEKERKNLQDLPFNVQDLLEKYQNAFYKKSSKNKGFTYGEYITFTEFLNIPLIQIGDVTFLMPDMESSPELIMKFKFGIELLERIFKSDNYDLVVLDEVNTAIKLGLIDVEELVPLLKNRNPKIEVILTGREKIPELIEIADYVTQIVEEKHPLKKGIKARKGIEY